MSSQNENTPVGALSAIVAPLLLWYDASARVLPWRENTKPYPVWVSEIMLQQTRVEAVKPYFDRFMAALPSLDALATAPEEQLLKLWEGLGYYNRVRNLQKAARQIIADFGGVFPQTQAALLSLSGVGDYTAGAIASICFGLPTPAVDGNVLRVVSRLCENYSDISLAPTKATITRQLAAIYPPDRSGAFTQSLMELGALVCLPRPKCQLCPLQDHCMAYFSGAQEDLPVKKAKKQRRNEEKTILLLYCDGRWAIEKRPDSGLLASLWQFPALLGHFKLGDIEAQMKSIGISPISYHCAPSKKHIFTHIQWQMESYIVACPLPYPAYTWCTRDELENYALPTAFKQFLPDLKPPQ